MSADAIDTWKLVTLSSHATQRPSSQAPGHWESEVQPFVHTPASLQY